MRTPRDGAGEARARREAAGNGAPTTLVEPCRERRALRLRRRVGEDLCVCAQLGRVTDETPGRPPTRALVDALNVPRNAAVGAVVGLLLAAGAYAFRVFEVAGPFGGTRQYPVLGPEGWFLVLAFVLATTTALLVASLLTLVSAYRVARQT